MKRALTVIPLLTLALFALGFTLRALTDDSELRHFPTPSTDEIFLDIQEPFGDRALEGTVVGARGETLVDACVFAMSNDVPYWDRTNEAGHFRLERLSPGPWRVVVVARGHVSQVFEIGDETQAITLKLQTALDPYAVIPEVERSRLAGRIVETTVPDLDVAALEGYEIFLKPSTPLDDFASPFPRRALIDAEGRFEIDGLLHGRYEVIILPRWAQGGTWPNLCAAIDRDFEFSPESDAASTSFELERGEIVGQLTDTRGSFVEGALIVVERLDDARFVWPPVPTDSGGNFRLRDLPPGAYRITARAGAGSVEQTAEVQIGVELRLDLDPLATQGE